MELKVKQDCEGVDWSQVAAILKGVGMAYRDPDVHRMAFEASHTTIFVYNTDNRLIGFGRAISDGVYQGAIYDFAVLPECQGQGIGTAIITTIMARLSHCHLILYASPGKEGFYERHGFRRLKTGMALFQNDPVMQHKGYTQ
jgi:ribosomal protein S18 acetylase RimI-like enzyme